MTVTKYATFIGILICSYWLFPHTSARGQSYEPRKTHSKNSVELIEYIKRNLLYNLRKSDVTKLDLAYEKSTKKIIDMVEREMFIDDDTLQAFVDGVVEKIKSNNTLRNSVQLVLISKSPVINAYNFGQGVIIVNVGLLARVENEGQLAFVIAHEIAHNELNHVTIKSLQVGTNEKAVKQQRKNLAQGNITKEGLDVLRNIASDGSNLSLALETQADLKGYGLFTAAGYAKKDALKALTLLQDKRQPKYAQGELLLMPFDSRSFPIQPHWIRNRPKAYSQPTRSLLFGNDPLRSHPEYEKRKANIERLDGVVNSEPDNSSEDAIKMAEFETIAAAYYTRQFDHCLHLALQLRTIYKDHPYLTTTISKVLVKLYEARLEGTFFLYVPQFTANYHPELRQLNNFLYNLKDSELVELAYYYLSNSTRFDKQVEDHYYLLWKIAKHTNRANVRKRMKDSYRTKFPEGKYRSQMR